jgi:superfamily II DNA helicase RecQ
MNTVWLADLRILSFSVIFISLS